MSGFFNYLLFLLADHGSLTVGTSVDEEVNKAKKRNKEKC